VAGLELEEVDLAEVARHVADAVSALADAHGSELVLVGPGRPCVAQADVRRIERIVRNLVVNAIEHGEGREIVVTVAAGEDAAALAVRDHGVGLRPGEATMVFNRFWRADPARARTTGSTGLGLAIALEDARLHGGWLQAWGERGKGAQFRLTLPRLAGDDLERSPLPLMPADASRPAASSVRFEDQGV
jgi:two-component system, OmpR family, sensor histidine kinase MtrB